jgi:methionine synthase II (cobalamin-independent)
MRRSEERILTTHVGSIIRPEALLALGSHKIGPPQDVAAYAAALRDGVREVVRKQVAAGIDIVSDGEYGKSSWANYVLERIKGFEVREGSFDARDWLGRERERFPELIEAEFGQYRGLPAWAELRVRALNHALRGHPARIASATTSAGAAGTGRTPSTRRCATVVDLLLAVNAGYYSIEQANPRHEHEWRVWEDVKLPEGRKLIPGVVTHHTNVVEHPELVAQRLVRLARLVGGENVIGGTDCGFAQAHPRRQRPEARRD